MVDVSKAAEDQETVAQAKLEAEEVERATNREAFCDVAESLGKLNRDLAPHGLSVAEIIRQHVRRSHGILV